MRYKAECRQCGAQADIRVHLGNRSALDLQLQLDFDLHKMLEPDCNMRAFTNSEVVAGDDSIFVLEGGNLRNISELVKENARLHRRINTTHEAMSAALTFLKGTTGE